MTIYDLRLHGGNLHFLLPEPRHSTDKIEGPFSTSHSAFSFIKYLVTISASIVAVHGKYATTARTIVGHTFKMAGIDKKL